MRLQFTNGRWSITVPTSAVKVKHWERGQEFDVRFNERGNIELYEIKPKKEKED